jgi:hypothetical protein
MGRGLGIARTESLRRSPDHPDRPHVASVTTPGPSRHIIALRQTHVFCSRARCGIVIAVFFAVWVPHDPSLCVVCVSFLLLAWLGLGSPVRWDVYLDGGFAVFGLALSARTLFPPRHASLILPVDWLSPARSLQFSPYPASPPRRGRYPPRIWTPLRGHDLSLLRR